MRAPARFLILGATAVLALAVPALPVAAADAPEKEKAWTPGQPIFHPLQFEPVSIGGGRAKLLVQTMIELTKPDDVKVVEEQTPKIRESFGAFLGTLSPEDLRAGGLYRIKLELRARLALILAGKAELRDLLITHLIVQ